jgi:hypothetical protein
VVKAKYFLLVLIAAALNSCEFGANAVDGSEIRVGEGTVFIYDERSDDRFFDRPIELSSSGDVEIKFLSKIAAIGGRDHVYGFQSSRDGELMFTDVKDGDLWVYFQANQDGQTPIERNGEWIRLPLPGEDEYSTEVSDSVFSFSRESPTFTTRTLRVAPMEQYNFYVEGYYFRARKVKVISDYHFDDFNDFGRPIHDEQELTFLEGLGVLAEKVVHAENIFGPPNFIMSGIKFK